MEETSLAAAAPPSPPSPPPRPPPLSLRIYATTHRRR
jgi:hypothetical protein